MQVISLRIHPLRERVEDIPILVEHFVKRYSLVNNEKVKGITSDALDILERYSWPGNIRELENVIERAVIFADGDRISMDNIPDTIKQNDVGDTTIQIPSEIGTGQFSIETYLEMIEKRMMLEALDKAGGVKKVAAKYLGISFRAFRYKIEKHGIGKDEKVLYNAAKEYGLDPKKELWRLPAMFVGQYAERDAEATLKLWQKLHRELHDQELIDIFRLETQLFPCLIEMRFKGVRVDLEKAHKIKKNLMAREQKILNKIKDLTGLHVEIMAARSIAKAFDKLKLPYDRTAKSKEPSFTKNFLQNHPHELAQSIADAREINKAH